MSAALAFSHGANDAQKSVGVIAALLLADGRIDTLAAPTWAKLAVRGGADRRHGARRMADHSHRGPPHLPHPGRSRVWPARPRRRGSSSGPRCVGAPVSTTQVVASSVVGIGAGRRRWHHVHWAVVRQMGLAWLDHDARDRRARRGRARALAAGGMTAAAVVPARDARRARAAAPPGRGHDRGRGRVRGVGGRRRERGAGRARRRAPRGRGEARAAERAAGRPSSPRSSPRTCSRSRAASTASSTTRATS